MKITKRQLRRIINEAEKSVPFGSGLEPAKGLDADEKDIIGHTWLAHVKRKDSALEEVGKVMWHSLDENGKIEIYDVQWPDGTVETNIPVAMLEGVQITEHPNEGQHGVQKKDTPVNERNYKGKMMKITKRQLRRIIKEEKAKILEEGLPGGYRHPKTGEDLFLMLNDAVDKLLDQGIDTMELANELRGLADDVEDSAPMNAEDQFVDAGIRAREMSKRR